MQHAWESIILLRGLLHECNILYYVIEEPQVLFWHVAYDVTRRETFESLDEIWMREVDMYSTIEDAVKMVVANKLDKVGSRTDLSCSSSLSPHNCTKAISVMRRNFWVCMHKSCHHSCHAQNKPVWSKLTCLART